MSERPSSLVRLQKVIAAAGVAARRKAEALIAAGRVQVNGRVVREQGTRVDPRRDEVRVDGRRLLLPDAPIHLAFYKPAGVLCALSDARGLPTVADYVREVGARVFPVGRLDFAAEGAVLLTTDGALAHALTHGHRSGPKQYLAKVKGRPEPPTLLLVRTGVRLEDGVARAREVAVVGRADKNTWLRFVVDDARHDLVRRLCAAVGHPVARLFRPAFAGVGVEGLSPGEWRELLPAEVKVLRAVAAGAREPGTGAPALPPRVHGRPHLVAGRSRPRVRVKRGTR